MKYVEVNYTFELTDLVKTQLGLPYISTSSESVVSGEWTNCPDALLSFQLTDTHYDTDVYIFPNGKTPEITEGCISPQRLVFKQRVLFFKDDYQPSLSLENNNIDSWFNKERLVFFDVDHSKASNWEIKDNMLLWDGEWTCKIKNSVCFKHKNTQNKQYYNFSQKEIFTFNSVTCPLIDGKNYIYLDKWSFATNKDFCMGEEETSQVSTQWLNDSFSNNITQNPYIGVQNNLPFKIQDEVVVGLKNKALQSSNSDYYKSNDIGLTENLGFLNNGSFVLYSGMIDPNNKTNIEYGKDGSLIIDNKTIAKNFTKWRNGFRVILSFPENKSFIYEIDTLELDSGKPSNNITGAIPHKVYGRDEYEKEINETVSSRLYDISTSITQKIEVDWKQNKINVINSEDDIFKPELLSSGLTKKITNLFGKTVTVNGVISYKTSGTDIRENYCDKNKVGSAYTKYEVRPTSTIELKYSINSILFPYKDELKDTTININLNPSKKIEITHKDSSTYTTGEMNGLFNYVSTQNTPMNFPLHSIGITDSINYNENFQSSSMKNPVKDSFNVSEGFYVQNNTVPLAIIIIPQGNQIESAFNDN